MNDTIQERSATDSAARVPGNPKWYRQVLGQYPTGVCIITAPASNGPPAGMAVGSFTSVSLDPPLVAFLPDRGSTSWPRIRETGLFCVNILAADQEHICRRFAAKALDKFDGLPHRPSPLGSPVIDGVVAWIDCALQDVFDAGDHYIVIGRVHQLQIESGSSPLVFFQGAYGQVSPCGVLTRA